MPELTHKPHPHRIRKRSALLLGHLPGELLVHLVAYDHFDDPFAAVGVDLLEPLEEFVECGAGRDVVDFRVLVASGREAG